MVRSRASALQEDHRSGKMPHMGQVFRVGVGPQFGGGTNTSGAQQGGSKYNLGVAKQIHDEIGPLVDGIRRRFNRVSFIGLCNAGGVNIKELPRIPGYEDDKGHNNVCYLGMMGMCNFDDAKLVDERDITPDFAKKFSRAIKPALEKYGQGQNDHKHYGRPDQH